MNIAKTYGYDQVVIYARKIGSPSFANITAAGTNDKHSIVASAIGECLLYDVLEKLCD